MNDARRHTMNEETYGHGGQSASYLKGLFAGALVGAAAGILFAPQAYAGLRRLGRQLRDTASTVGDAAAERYRQAGVEVGGAVDDLHEKGRGAYGTVLSAVARGAQDVKDHATEAKIELDRKASNAPGRRHSS